MRKLIVATLIAATAILGSVGVGTAAPPAASTTVSEPNVLVGTYQYRDAGYRVVVGFAPCGHQWTEGTTTYYDPSAQYEATVKQGGGWTYEAWAHDPTDLNGALDVIGISLTQQAIDTLNEDAATYTCTG